jgi:hypothetical protein
LQHLQHWLWAYACHLRLINEPSISRTLEELDTLK